MSDLDCDCSERERSSNRAAHFFPRSADNRLESAIGSSETGRPNGETKVENGKKHIFDSAQVSGVRIEILVLIFEDSPTFKNEGAQLYLGSDDLSKLLQKLGKTHEEAAAIVDKVIPTPSHYRLQLTLNDEQERHARGTFTQPW